LPIAGALGRLGGRLYYELAGAGPLIALLHDGILHSEVWDAQWRELAEQCRVVRYDRRGYGRSEVGEPMMELEHAPLALA
jgi:pimeloyl-ACP methyl ester carboxylesterase